MKQGKLQVDKTRYIGFVNKVSLKQISQFSIERPSNDSLSDVIAAFCIPVIQFHNSRVRAARLMSCFAYIKNHILLPT